MCGITGSLHFTLDTESVKQDLLHRGPDEQNYFEELPLRFFHHRLAILDIAGGHQPMHRNHLTIIFNGEIYNYEEVRKDMQLSCTTQSDTETILAAYEKAGPRCLHAFDGMFALAIYDRSRKELFLARDRAGKKPLYYYHYGKQFVFSSELNALQHQVQDQIQEENIKSFLRLGYFFQSNTPYINIKELPAGSYLITPVDNPKPVIRKWWDIHPFYQQRSEDDFSTALEKTEHFLRRAVKRRVEASDLEVGSFLSGGIDSGLVTAIAKEFNPGLKTFTVSFEGEYDEAPLAKKVADKYQTQHQEIRISYENLPEEVLKILYNYGEPFMDSSAIPSYYVSREAKKYLTVILNGDGGDELFGGYRRYVPFARFDFFKTPGWIKSISGFIHHMLPAPANKKSLYNYIYRLADFARKQGIAAYLSATIDIFEGYEKELAGGNDLADELVRHFEKINKSPLSGLQKIMNLDFDNILAGDLLVKMDIATMAYSLEGRSPLLGKELLEYIPTLPDDFKIKGKTTKYLLRRLGEKFLPQELIHQPKRGFEVPLKKWVNRELKEIIFSFLLSPNAYIKHFIKNTFLTRLCENKIHCGPEKRAKMLWTLFALEVWYQKCYKQNA
ncbi:MAG: asparagine synthase (glutamine-hydrolyzing) [Chitinophagaceae bacterium]|nr:asparagine synthase (glutamine-hydrolyzing) [Chitinophagaceae bacterium]